MVPNLYKLNKTAKLASKICPKPVLHYGKFSAAIRSFAAVRLSSQTLPLFHPSVLPQIIYTKYYFAHFTLQTGTPETD